MEFSRGATPFSLFWFYQFAATADITLRRAFERQKNFTSSQVESVANTTAFVSPGAFDQDAKHGQGAN